MQQILHQRRIELYPDGRMDTKNAAKYLGVSIRTLAMHRCKGTGPVFTKRGKIFYYRDDLDRWMREGRRVANSELDSNDQKSKVAQA